MPLDDHEKQMVGMLGLTLLAQRRDEEAKRKAERDEKLRCTLQYQAIIEEGDRQTRRTILGLFIFLLILITIFSAFVIYS